MGIFKAAVWLVLLQFHVSDAGCGNNPLACSPPATDQYISLSPSKLCYDDQEKLDYVCRGHLHGPFDNICSKGRWKLPNPSCEGFSCERPDVSNSVRIFPDKFLFDARETVQYSCVNENSIMEGPMVVSCENIGWYPSTKVFCSVICEAPVIEYGIVHINAPTKKGDTIKVTCEDGFVIQVGDSHRITCGDGGEWEHLPRCVKL